MAGNNVRSKVCAVIDYGMGNLHSAHGALQKVAPDTQVLVTSDPEQILKADHVVLPGVGAIRDCVGEIRQQGIDEVVFEVAKTKPLLGICIGMQTLLSHSQENGGVDCLNMFDGEVKFFAADGDLIEDDGSAEHGQKLKVPHMGWNQVQQVAHPLWNEIADNSRFYFVHSYYAKAANPAEVKARCHYGVDFDVALAKENVFAVQFHPEKSHANGLQLLKNFLDWDGQS